MYMISFHNATSPSTSTHLLSQEYASQVVLDNCCIRGQQLTFKRPCPCATSACGSQAYPGLAKRTEEPYANGWCCVMTALYDTARLEAEGTLQGGYWYYYIKDFTIGSI